MVGVPAEIIAHYIRTRGVRKGVQQWLKRAYLRKTTDHNGEIIFTEDWDVLVILDACRPDLFRETSDEYSWIDHVETRQSVGTATKHWMEETFSTVERDMLQQTAYICANPFSDRLLDAEQFSCLNEVWKWGWDDEEGTVPPRPVTDTAISVAREQSPKRLLIHYMQPHTPFLESDESPQLTLKNFTGSGSRPLDDWELVEIGERAEHSVWEDYKTNLRVVLDEVELLRENVDAERMVITSDHGNAVGERGLYGHPGGVSIPALYEVPWCETDATDKGIHQPPSYRTENIPNDVESKLRALGYV